MEAVVPWSELEALIKPYYPKAGKGRQPVGLSFMCASTFCSTGSACQAQKPRMRSTIHLRYAASPTLILAAPPRPTSRPS